jgi:hypothetical protein
MKGTMLRKPHPLLLLAHSNLHLRLQQDLSTSTPLESGQQYWFETCNVAGGGSVHGHVHKTQTCVQQLLLPAGSTVCSHSLQMMAAAHIHVKIHQEQHVYNNSIRRSSLYFSNSSCRKGSKKCIQHQKNYFVCISQHQHAWLHQQVPFLMKATAAVC